MLYAPAAEARREGLPTGSLRSEPMYGDWMPCASTSSGASERCPAGLVERTNDEDGRRLASWEYKPSCGPGGDQTPLGPELPTVGARERTCAFPGRRACVATCRRLTELLIARLYAISSTS